MAQIASNYITHPNTRKSRSKSHWVWIGSAFAVLGLLSFHGATNSQAKELTGDAAKNIWVQGEVLDVEAGDMRGIFRYDGGIFFCKLDWGIKRFEYRCYDDE